MHIPASASRGVNGKHLIMRKVFGWRSSCITNGVARDLYRGRHSTTQLEVETMKFYSRHWVKHEDLNGGNGLFGGRLLAWIDEEAAIFAGCQMGSPHLVTKYIGAIDFQSPARVGDVIEFGLEVAHCGTTSLTVRCLVRNKHTHLTVVDVREIVFVSVDEQGRPIAHRRGMREAV